MKNIGKTEWVCVFLSLPIVEVDNRFWVEKFILVYLSFKVAIAVVIFYKVRYCFSSVKYFVSLGEGKQRSQNAFYKFQSYC